MESGMHGDDAMRLKLAVALAMWRTSHRPKSGTEENQWRKKAKVLEEKCSMVTEQLEELRGAIDLDRLPLLAPCKCHFFKSTDTESRITYDDYVMQISVQIFLRNVRFLRRLKPERSGDDIDEVQDYLATVIDFAIDLTCQTKPIHLKGKYAEAYMHHAVDFIKDQRAFQERIVRLVIRALEPFQTAYCNEVLIADTIPLLLEGNEEKRIHVDSLVEKLVLNLVAKLLNFTTDQGSSEESELDDKERVLVVMLRLSQYAYIGHRMLLAASQEKAMVLERLQCMDPFDEGFSQIYENLFVVFQLVETLIAEYMSSWKEENNVGQDILEEWVTCHFRCKTILEGRPTIWTSQIMAVLDSITEKLLKQLQCSVESNTHGERDLWQKALVHLLASASFALPKVQQ